MAIDDTVAMWNENAGDVYNAREYRRLLGSLIGMQTAVLSAGDLLVTQNHLGIDRSVDVAIGGAAIMGSLDPTQGAYYLYNDDVVNVPLAVAHASFTRYDRIVAYVLDTEYGQGSDSAVIDKVTGTASGSPVVPDPPENSITLATVTVGPNDTTIANSDIADTRPILQTRPPGEIAMWGGAAAPSGWALCDGGITTQAADPLLYAVIGNTFNDGTETGTQFRRPDFRGVSPLGVGTGTLDGNALTARSRGDRGGEETHLIIATEMPSHPHGITDGGHNHGPGGGAGEAIVSHLFSGTPDYQLAGASGLNPGFKDHNATAGNFTGITINPAGGDDPHNNMGPFLAVNFIIKR